jgi:hypothetical protein
MTYKLKLKGNEQTATTANTIGNATLVRAYNNTASYAVITVANPTANTQENPTGNYASFTVGSNNEVYIVKTSTDTIQANGVLFVPIAFQG